jgi:hypothetical protein
VVLVLLDKVIMVVLDSKLATLLLVEVEEPEVLEEMPPIIVVMAQTQQLVEQV